MNPEQPTTPPTLPSTDYLNQIAPNAPKKPIFKFGPRLLIMIGVALVVLVAIVAITVNVVVAQQRKPLQQLAARFTATEAVATDAQDNIKSSQLRSLNSNLKIYLTNTNRDIGTPLLSAGVDTKKISDDVTNTESTDAMTSRLEDARLNARFDRIYALEMSTQLETLIILMTEILNSTSNQELRAFLESARLNLEPTQKAMADFNAANS